MSSDIQPNHRINLLSHGEHYPAKKIFKVSRFIIYLLTVLIIAAATFSYQIIFTNSSLTGVFTNKINIFKQLGYMVTGSGTLSGEQNDRINILLLGIGGAGHDGPYLTDTMMLASYKPSTQQLGLMSIPRDLLVNVPGYGWRKINEVNSIGETQGKGQGAEMTASVVSNILNLPINYYIVVDFSGFEKIIDELGGLKINVDQSFVDYQYPDNNYGFQPISFTAGMQTMDGDTALKFVRSRHGNNGENSDFSRSKRQQKVLEALKDRLLSYQFFLNPTTISDFSAAISTHLKTNMDPWEVVKLGTALQKINHANIINKVLSDAPDGLLHASIIDGGYYLQPLNNDFTEIQYLINHVFDTQSATPATNSVSAIRVEIRNGTIVSGLASRAATELKLLGYQVIKTGNAPNQALTKSVVYKITGEDRTDAENLLNKKYNTVAIHDNIPEWVKAEVSPDIDFFIVLGQDADTTK